MSEGFNAIESYIDAKIAFAQMEPPVRALHVEMLKAKRKRAVQAWLRRD